MTAITAELRKTALFNLHKELGGKMSAFARYSLPLQYNGSSTTDICMHTRQKAGLFDVSHMGQLRLYGKDRAKLLERLTVANVQALQPQDSKLTLFTNEAGGIIDDCIVTAQEGYLQLVVNAANKETDVAHIKNNILQFQLDVTVEVQDDRSLIALQGPAAMNVLQPLVPIDLRKMKFMKGALNS